MTRIQHKTFTLIYCCLIFVIGLGLFWNAAAATVFKIITLEHRFAEEILPAILPLVGSDGTASAMQNNLIIRTNTANMTEIEQIIRSLDMPRQHLKITVNRNQNQSANDSSGQFSSNKRVGNIVIKNGKTQTIRDGVALDLEHQQSRSNISNTQFIQVTAGEKAFISVGQSVPYTQEWIHLTKQYASIQRISEFVTIDIGFAIRPRTIGNQIELEVTPRFSQLNKNRVIDFETFTTTIRTNRGEWINLASLMHENNDITRAIFRWQTNHESSNSQFSIKVE